MSKEKIIYHTFEEWLLLGYGVLKGAKSTTINSSFEKTFSIYQVSKIKKYYYHNDFDGLYGYGNFND